MKTQAYAALAATSALAPYTIERREPGRRDVLIDIIYCGVCHSDIHQARGEWPNSIFPMVPGHEIVGRVAGVGTEGKNFAPGIRSASAAWSIRAANVNRARPATNNTASAAGASRTTATSRTAKRRPTAAIRRASS